jgi:hypothetical protein
MWLCDANEKCGEGSAGYELPFSEGWISILVGTLEATTDRDLVVLPDSNVLTFSWTVDTGDLTPGSTAVVPGGVWVTVVPLNTQLTPEMLDKANYLPVKLPWVYWPEDARTDRTSTGLADVVVDDLQPGAYELIIADNHHSNTYDQGPGLQIAVGRLPFVVGVGLALSGLVGYEAGEPYAAGETFSIDFFSRGATLPLTLSLRNYFEGQDGHAEDEHSYVTWTLPAGLEEGTYELTLPASLPHGYYGAPPPPPPPLVAHVPIAYALGCPHSPTLPTPHPARRLFPVRLCRDP